VLGAEVTATGERGEVDADRRMEGDGASAGHVPPNRLPQARLVVRIHLAPAGDGGRASGRVRLGGGLDDEQVAWGVRPALLAVFPWVPALEAARERPVGDDVFQDVHDPGLGGIAGLEDQLFAGRSLDLAATDN